MSLSKEQWIKIGEVIGGNPKDIEREIIFSYYQKVRDECSKYYGNCGVCPVSLDFGPEGDPDCLTYPPKDWTDEETTRLIEKVLRKEL